MNFIEKNVFVLTGAGISRESGIKTFRENDGLWDNYKIEDVCTVEAFLKNPNYVNKFYNERRKVLNDKNIRPNDGHKALAKIEKLCKEYLLVTQNIDDLHEKAGSNNILHMHGTLDRAFCMKCNYNFKLNSDISTSDICTNCKKQGGIRIDVVWFGEQPKYLDKIYNFLKITDYFISIGTSNNVYPAAGFIDYTKNFNQKAKFLEFNIEQTSKSQLFDKIFIGPASKTIPNFLKEI